MFAKQFTLGMRWTSVWILAISGLVLNGTAVALDSKDASTIAPSSGAIVIGFVGGFVRRDDAVHQEVQLANRLQDVSPAITAKIFENRQGKEAHRAVLQLLDADHDGGLSDREKRTADIVIYGHSWGASEAVTLARSLGKDGIPVLLTIQVDSVSKLGQDDRLIPANVAQAINFYQLDGILHGRREILAADQLRTEILGNFRIDYKNKRINCDGYPWFAQVFMKPHIEIESDPNVWNRVESLIRSKLPTASITR